MTAPWLKWAAARCADSSTTSASSLFGPHIPVHDGIESLILALRRPSQAWLEQSLIRQAAVGQFDHFKNCLWPMHGMMLWWTYSSSEPACTGCHPHHESAGEEQNWCCCTEACFVHVEVSLSVLMILWCTCLRRILHNSLPSGPIPFKCSGNVLW